MKLIRGDLRVIPLSGMYVYASPMNVYRESRKGYAMYVPWWSLIRRRLKTKKDTLGKATEAGSKECNFKVG